MAISCTTTAYGPPALAELARIIERHKNGDPLAPVTVLVPGNYAGIAARRALGRGGLAAASFLTVYRLAEQLGAGRVAARGRRPVSTPVLAGAVRAVLADEAGHFAGVENHPATERALVRAHRELSEVDDPGLRRLAATSRRAHDVVRIHRQVARRLAADFSNEQDLVAAAIEEITEKPRRLAEVGPIIVFLPQRLTSTQVRLLDAIAARSSLDLVVGLTGDPGADATVVDIAERLRCEPDPPARPATRAPTRALSVSDADDEVRHAVREVVDAARAGVHLGRCAVLYGTAEPYARLVTDALDGAGIGWFGASVRTAEASLLGRSLLALLALGDHDLSRRDVTAWLSSAPIRDSENRSAPVAAWERAARRAGIMAGRDQWLQRLDRLATDLDEEAERLDHDDQQDWRADGRRRDAARTRELARFIDRLAVDLEPGPRGRRWSGLAGWCRELLRSYLGGEGHRHGWPDDERRAADRVEAAIDRLADLDGVDPNPSVAAFRRALGLELENDLGRHGRFGTGVLVGPVGFAVGVELDHVVLLGLAEGSFPARRRDDALLPDRERRVVGPDLPLRATRAQQEHHDLLAVLSAAGESVMMYPRGDLRRGADRAPSRWLLDAAEVHDGMRPTTDTVGSRTGQWFVEVPSFVAGLRRTEFPAHEQEYDVRALLAAHDDGHDPARHPVSAQRREVARGLELTSARASRSFTRFDGNLATAGDLRGSRLPSPTDSEMVVSATRLEAWTGCPHAYFVRYVLGVDAVEPPEHEYRISPLAKGALIHRVLDRWLSEALESRSVPEPDQTWSESWRSRLLDIGVDECDRSESRGLAGRPLYWRRDRKRILADLVTAVDFDDRCRRLGRATPTATELGFGMPGSKHGPVAVGLPDGRSIQLRGAIDRVDRNDAGQLVIIDYKTGSSAAFRAMSTDDPTAGGGHLQLVLYAAAAGAMLGESGTTALGSYRFVSSTGRFEDHGYEVTPEVEAVVLTLVAAISDGIASGLFPRHPAEPGWRNRVPCWFCEPDGLGTRDQWREWERKRDHPDMRGYLAIAEPDLLLHVGSGP